MLKNKITKQAGAKAAMATLIGAMSLMAVATSASAQSTISLPLETRTLMMNESQFVDFSLLHATNSVNNPMGTRKLRLKNPSPNYNSFKTYYSSAYVADPTAANFAGSMIGFESAIELDLVVHEAYDSSATGIVVGKLYIAATLGVGNVIESTGITANTVLTVGAEAAFSGTFNLSDGTHGSPTNLLGNTTESLSPGVDAAAPGLPFVLEIFDGNGEGVNQYFTSSFIWGPNPYGNAWGGPYNGAYAGDVGDFSGFLWGTSKDYFSEDLNIAGCEGCFTTSDVLGIDWTLMGNMEGNFIFLPEPTSMALFGFSLAALGFVRRRRNTAR